MARTHYGPQVVLDASGAPALNASGGRVYYDQGMTSQVTDMSTSPSGASISEVAADARAVVELWGPDDGYKRILWADFGWGPLPLLPPEAMSDAIDDTGAGGVADGGITTEKIHDAAVTSEKIGTAAVGTDEIAAGAVTSSELGPDAVTSDAIAAGAVGSDELAAGAVIRSKIGAAAVGSTEIEDGKVIRSKIGAAAVGSTEIEDRKVIRSKIALKAVSAAEIDDATIDTGQLKDGSVTSAKILNGTIAPGDLDRAYVPQTGHSPAALLIVDGAGAVMDLAHTGVAGQVPVQTATGWQITDAPGGGTGGGVSLGITNPEAWGAVGDGRYLTATTTAGSAVAVVPGILATDAGKLMSIAGAASTNGHLVKIGPINTSTNQVTMYTVGTTTTVTASASVSGAECLVGTDSSAAFAAMNTAAQNSTGPLTVYGSWDSTTGKPKVYVTNQSVKWKSRLRLRDLWLATRYSGNPHPIHKTALAPGFTHGAALNLSTPSTSYQCWPLADIARGDTVITGTGGASSRGTTGGITASPLKKGVLAFIFSDATSIVSGVSTPHRNFMTKITADSGETLTLADPVPWSITGGAWIAYVDPTETAVTGGPLAAPTWIAEDISAENCILDALHPFWGGAARNLTVRGIQPAPGKKWSEIISLNMISWGLFEDISGDFTYTAVELKFGSYKTTVRRCRGKWAPGASTYTPIGIGEGSTGITIEDCTWTLPDTFNDVSRVMVDVRNASDVRIVRNDLVCDATGLDAVFACPPTTTSTFVCRDITFSDNRITTSTGVSRVIKAGPATTSAVYVDGMTITGNRMYGALKSTVNEWALIANINDLVMHSNVPDGLVTGSVGPSQLNMQKWTGYVDGNLHRGMSGAASPEITLTGWVDMSTISGTTVDFGALPNRALITKVSIRTTTAFSAGATLNIGHSSTAAAFVSGAPVTSTGCLTYEGGVAAPSAGGSLGTILGDRMGSYSSTSTRTARITVAGSPTAGKALVTISYVTGIPDVL